MKTIKSAILILCLITTTVFASTGDKTVTVTVKNIKSDKGKIIISVFDSNDTFLKKSIKKITVKCNGKETIEIKIKDLPVGTYAIAVVHDKNDNDALDSNFMGIPKEPYGFSNNAKGSFGPPSFEDSKFEISTDKSIKLEIIIDTIF